MLDGIVASVSGESVRSSESSVKSIFSMASLVEVSSGEVGGSLRSSAKDAGVRPSSLLVSVDSGSAGGPAAHAAEMDGSADSTATCDLWKMWWQQQSFPQATHVVLHRSAARGTGPDALVDVRGPADAKSAIAAAARDGLHCSLKPNPGKAESGAQQFGAPRHTGVHARTPKPTQTLTAPKGAARATDRAALDTSQAKADQGRQSPPELLDDKTPGAIHRRPVQQPQQQQPRKLNRTTVVPVAGYERKQPDVAVPTAAAPAVPVASIVVVPKRESGTPGAVAMERVVSHSAVSPSPVAAPSSSSSSSSAAAAVPATAGALRRSFTQGAAGGKPVLPSARTFDSTVTSVDTAVALPRVPSTSSSLCVSSSPPCPSTLSSSSSSSTSCVPPPPPWPPLDIELHRLGYAMLKWRKFFRIATCSEMFDHDMSWFMYTLGKWNLYRHYIPIGSTTKVRLALTQLQLFYFFFSPFPLDNNSCY
eukprot:GHVT01027864.1.p1 GENE.GHVT01027864.1~~GHVT01027864.1.p1  ORF type:complete len:524 (+),score=151.43 GHVT01027864.1:143-1573(+)